MILVSEPLDPSIIHNLKVGLVILVTYGLMFSGLFLVARSMAKPNIPEQAKGPGIPANLTPSVEDEAQENEINRLHVVDQHFDKRLDRIEPLIWPLIVLNALAAITQIWGAFR